MSAGQQWAGCLAGLVIALTSAGAAAAQRPLPDPSPAAQAQTPAPDPAPGATARQVVRRPPTVAIQSAPASPVGSRPAASAATPQRTVGGGGGGATARTKTTAPVTAATTPAATSTKARTPSGRRPAHRRPTHRAVPPPRLRLDAVRRVIAALAPVAVAARPRAGDETLRAVLTVAGAALLALAATGSVTLGRATARARA